MCTCFETACQQVVLTPTPALSLSCHRCAAIVHHAGHALAIGLTNLAVGALTISIAFVYILFSNGRETRRTRQLRPGVPLRASVVDREAWVLHAPAHSHCVLGHRMTASAYPHSVPGHRMTAWTRPRGGGGGVAGVVYLTLLVI